METQLYLKAWYQVDAARFVEILHANPRQNCVGTASSTKEDWEAYDKKLILEFACGDPDGLTGTLREHSDGLGCSDFWIVLEGVLFRLTRKEDVFKITWIGPITTRHSC